jgi:hypothetical protein
MVNGVIVAVLLMGALFWYNFVYKKEDLTVSKPVEAPMAAEDAERKRKIEFLTQVKTKLVMFLNQNQMEMNKLENEFKKMSEETNGDKSRGPIDDQSGGLFTIEGDSLETSFKTKQEMDTKRANMKRLSDELMQQRDFFMKRYAETMQELKALEGAF